MPTPLSLSIPFSLSLSLSLSLVYPCRLSSRCLSFHGFRLLARRRRASSSVSLLQHSALARSRSFLFTHIVVFLSSLFLFIHRSRFVSTRDSLPFNGTDGDSSVPDPVFAPDCYPPSRNGNYHGVLFPGSRAREIELPDNPLICPVITSHRLSSAIPCRRGGSRKSRSCRLESQNATPNKLRTRARMIGP